MVFALAMTAAGCSELRARRYAQEGNRHFHDGDYRAALASYGASERLHPLAAVALNQGLACRQLLLPGAKSAENARAVECALTAFQQLKKLSPKDARADQLYLQTLFDADRYEQLAAIFQKQLQLAPDDPGAINALVQVYNRSGQWEEALRWMNERVKRRPNDAEAHHAVGVFIYSRLLERGGGSDQSSFEPQASVDQKAIPELERRDITGDERVALAERGIKALQIAVQLRPSYADAMTYLGLLYRQKALAYPPQSAARQEAVDLAEGFRQKASALHTQPQP